MIERKDAMQRVRLAHTRSLLDELRRAGPLSRAELVQRTGLSRTTLFDIIADLLARNVVVEREPVVEGQRGRGRPSSAVSLNPAAGQVLGIDLGRARISAVIANVGHDILAGGSRTVAASASPGRRATAAIALVEELVERHGVDLGTLEAIGLGLPGLVGDPGRPDGTRGLTAAARRTADRFREHFGAPVLPDNNSHLAALAEATWGAAQDSGDVVYVRWGDGVGGGLIVDGRPVRGAHGAAGELGHVSLDPDGDPCPCGGRGCLELRIRAGALLAECAARGEPVGDVTDLIDRAAGGAAVPAAVVRDAAGLLGHVIAGTVVQLDPSRVVIGGDLGRLGDLVLDPVRQAIRRLAIPRHPRRLEVVAARLGDDDGALGAVAAVLRQGAPDPQLAPSGARD